MRFAYISTEKVCQEKFEDTKQVIRNRKSKKDRSAGILSFLWTLLINQFYFRFKLGVILPDLTHVSYFFFLLKVYLHLLAISYTNTGIFFYMLISRKPYIAIVSLFKCPDFVRLCWWIIMCPLECLQTQGANYTHMATRYYLYYLLSMCSINSKGTNSQHLIECLGFSDLWQGKTL